VSWYFLVRAFNAIRCAFVGHRWVESVAFRGIERCERCDVTRFA
jgi:hypothetical protein